MKKRFPGTPSIMQAHKGGAYADVEAFHNAAHAWAKSTGYVSQKEKARRKMAESDLAEGYAVGDLLLKLFKDTRAQAKAAPMIREKLVELAARSTAELKKKHHEEEAEIVVRVAREGGSWEDAKDALSI